MTPSGRRRKPATSRARKPRKTQYKKQLLQQPKNQESQVDLPCNSSNSRIIEFEEGVDDDNASTTTSTCSTPKGKKFRIPEIRTCPPAPKKQRVASTSNCSLQRSPIAFFAPPDLELFFFFALGNIPA